MAIVPDLPRNALLSFDHSPWAKMESSQSSLAYSKVTGIGLQAFNYLSNIFSTHPLFDSKFKFRGKGLSPRAVLGIILTYMRSPCYEHNISMTFGTTRSATNRYINAGLRLLRTLMSTHPSSRVLWPTPVEMAAHAEAIARKKPVLRNTGLFGFVDGFRLSIKNFKCEVDQNAYYNYHEKETCVGNIVVFTPDGCCVLSDTCNVDTKLKT